MGCLPIRHFLRFLPAYLVLLLLLYLGCRCCFVVTLLFLLSWCLIKQGYEQMLRPIAFEGSFVVTRQIYDFGMNMADFASLFTLLVLSS